MNYCAKRWLITTVALSCLLSFAACGKAGVPAPVPAPTPEQTEQAAPEPTPESTLEPTPEATPEPTPEPTVVDFRFTEPDGFVLDPENPMKLITSSYPADPS